MYQLQKGSQGRRNRVGMGGGGARAEDMGSNPATFPNMYTKELLLYGRKGTPTSVSVWGAPEEPV